MTVCIKGDIVEPQIASKISFSDHRTPDVEVGVFWDDLENDTQPNRIDGALDLPGRTDCPELQWRFDLNLRPLESDQA